MSEQALALAIIQQAIEDAKLPEPIKMIRFKRDPSKMIISSAWSRWHKSRGDALLFLMSSTGEWAKSRRAWCILAGIEPEALEMKAKKLLFGIDPKHA